MQHILPKGKNKNKQNLKSYNAKLKNQYLFVIQSIGYDIYSTKIWQRYIKFLKVTKLATNHNQFDGDFLNELRKLYRIILRRPLSSMDQLYDEYLLWEGKHAPRLKSELVKILLPGYEQAKKIYYEWCQHRRGILFHLNAVPSCTNLTSRLRDYRQIELWKRLIAWEMLNKLNNDEKKYLHRMSLVFKQALMPLRLYPDIWLLYIEFSIEFPLSKNKDFNTQNLFQSAITTIPNCVLLRILFCEYLERHHTMQV
jgi:cleavage stimulation factor subunit 3